ncbi:FAD-dependent oxidoreductase [Burkholderia ubonensis]|uniref:FAD-dependent oxidoreductase n=1 Tax=Burkholderia ubonensis TaxID=101571 RepID=UPI000752B839|nr:GMC family oxidoreductase [Burkholderia ubonensis]KVN95850.1 GMC family oxidoreductase [Burkholderia ubonensis]
MTSKPFEYTDYGSLDSITAEVCVIGSGCGGATVAYKLAEAGIDVVVLEKGGYYPASTFDNRELNQAGKVDADRAMTTSSNGSTILTYGELVGGTSVHYWADSFRTPADRLVLWREGYGITGHGQDDLDAAFAEIERRHHIHDVEPMYYNRMNQLFRGAVEALGWQGAPIKHARYGCAGSGQCMQGCALNAKQSQLVTSVPSAMELGARVYADLRAEQFTFTGKRATQLTASVIDRRRNRADGRKIVVKAKHFVVAAGGFNTPALMLSQPGLKESLPALGKHFGMNPTTAVHGMYDEPIILWRKVPAAYGVEEFRRARYDAAGKYIEGGYMLVPDQLQPAMMGLSIPGFDAGAGEWMARLSHVGGVIGWIDDHPRELGEVRLDAKGNREILYPYGPTTQQMLRDLMKKAAIANFKAGAKKVMIGDLHRTTLTSADQIGTIDNVAIKPGNLLIAAPHPFGGCRMGNDPRTSVTDSTHRVHGFDNLFVADPSVFPTGPSVDPSVTIMAFSYIAAGHVAAALGKTLARPS